MRRRRLAVLLSGRGSNFLSIDAAIGRGEIDADIAVVVSNKVDAGGLSSAGERGFPAYALDHRQFASREEHEVAVREAIDRHEPDFICLAGYMRRLTPSFVDSYPNRIINIHPSLLPAFPGVDAQQQAVEHGVKVTGCTVHFVDSGVDTGPIIVQKAIAIEPGETADQLSARLLPIEHAAYIEALKIVCSGRYEIDGRRIRVTA